MQKLRNAEKLKSVAKWESGQEGKLGGVGKLPTVKRSKWETFPVAHCQAEQVGKRDNFAMEKMKNVERWTKEEDNDEMLEERNQRACGSSCFTCSCVRREQDQLTTGPPPKVAPARTLMPESCLGTHVGRLNYVFVAGFLLFSTLHRIFIGLSSDIHQMFTGCLPEVNRIHRNSFELHQNLTESSVTRRPPRSYNVLKASPSTPVICERWKYWPWYNIM